MELFQASNQWAQRPADERFWTLEEGLSNCSSIKNSAREAVVPLKQLKAEELPNNEIAIVGPNGNQAIPTNYCFSQLCKAANAPTGYLQSLPATLATTNLNHGLQKSDKNANLLLHQNGHLVLRAITSNQYGRIWNSDIMRRLIDLQGQGWQVPPARPAHREDSRTRPATESDVIRSSHHSLGIKLGDQISPAGIYVSDRDMFVFMINDNRRIDDGSEAGLSRGFFCENSEVGDGAWYLTKFLYESVCGNHIVWSASQVVEIRVVHRGNAEQRFDRNMLMEVKKFADGSASEDEAKIQSAQQYRLGQNPQEVINLVFGKGLLSRKEAQVCYASAVEQVEVTGRGDPLSAWGFADGVTRFARTLPYADARNQLDRTAGKIIKMAF